MAVLHPSNHPATGGRSSHRLTVLVPIVTVALAMGLAGELVIAGLQARAPSTSTSTVLPTAVPTVVATASVAPTAEATALPTSAPTVGPTAQPTADPGAPPPQTFTIAVPVMAQVMTLDCETAALQMGLATYGHYASQAELFALENPDLRRPLMGPDHTVLRWGDPYTNFVGDVNGSDRVPTGYGVYWPVILSIAHRYGLTNATGGEGYAPATVYNALQNGKAVEVWIETNWARTTLGTWTAFDGRRVRYSFIEHAVTLSGVSASQVRVNDPLHGTQYWIAKSLFETNWADFNNMAVIF